MNDNTGNSRGLKAEYFINTSIFQPELEKVVKAVGVRMKNIL